MSNYSIFPQFIKIAKTAIFSYNLVMEIINILGININTFVNSRVLVKIKEFLNDNRQHYIVTPNPEIILTAKHDEEFFYILNQAGLAIPDGVALKFCSWLMGVYLKRITGADLVKDILVLAQEQNRKIAIFNWQRGLSNEKDIYQVLNKIYPKLEIIVVDIDRQATLSGDKLALVNNFKPEIIFCTLGAPFQEKFIFHNLKKIPSAKLGMSVGGSFDYLTGKIKRAPFLIRRIGLEWLWRLVKQPSRWRRIYRAVIVFPYKFFLWRFVYPHLYRKNVACLLYRVKENSYEILLLERANDPGHWQLPQGGTEGQNLEEAGSRELREEINTDKFKSVAVFPNLNIYEFGDKTSYLGVKYKDYWGYRGQKQGLFIAEFFGTDQDIKVNYWEHSSWRWVIAEKLIETLHPIRRASAKIFLEKFKEKTKKNNLKLC
jgi:N-acetylglucosaminyldiphosphoundecaprenol N-acetyl-beta-D-mannosaminyltransferase